MIFATVAPEDLMQRLKLGSDVRLVSYLGTIERRKNPKTILDLAEKMKDRANVHFVLAGRGGSQYSDEVKRRAGELPNVTYLGEVGEREKVQLIKASYLNILLSRMEALGLTQLEFMFLGVPVVTSAAGGQSWLIRNGQEGIHLKGPSDLEGAEEAITDLVADSAKWHKLSASAAARAKPFALSNLIADLDSAITKELERESGLATLSPEVRSTLSEPEVVVRIWSHGSQKVLATDKRIFIQHGRLSRSTLELPFASINSIEHMRRYRWRTVVVGAIISAMLFVQHFMFPIISRNLTSSVIGVLSVFIPQVRSLLPQNLPAIILLPLLVGLVIFGIGIRKGYALHGATLKPIYFPQSFGETVKFIREGQDHIREAQENLNKQPQSVTS
jgi:hypothetical protein